MEQGIRTGNAGPATPRLYVHTKRPEWGPAMCVGERESGAEYQFRDGQIRIIGAAYAHLMDEARPEESTSELLEELEALHEAAAPRDPAAKRSLEQRLAALDDQVASFLERYPGGFEDPKWLQEMRGQGPGRRRKQHRDPTLADASKLLGRAECERLLAGLQHDKLVDRLVRVLRGTSLVSPAHVRPLTRMDSTQKRIFADALRDLLHGQERYELRFLKVLQSLSRIGAGRWAMATAPSALLHPKEHVCVRPNLFRAQAKRFGQGLRIPNAPTSRQYYELQRMAQAVRDHLESRDLHPRDNLDVYDFISCTARQAKKAAEPDAPTPRASGVGLRGGAVSEPDSNAA